MSATEGVLSSRPNCVLANQDSASSLDNERLIKNILHFVCFCFCLSVHGITEKDVDEFSNSGDEIFAGLIVSYPNHDAVTRIFDGIFLPLRDMDTCK